MKIFCISLFLALLMVGCEKERPVEPASEGDILPSDMTTEEQALLSDIRKMFEQRDISLMMTRVHKKGVENWWLDIERDYLNDVLKGVLGRLELTRIDPPEREEKLMDGSIAEWSLPLKWELIIHQPSDDSMMNISHTISLSEHEGRIVSIRQISKGEQGEADQPATAPESKPEGNSKPQPEPKVRHQ